MQNTNSGGIDPFRVTYRQQRKAIMGEIIREGLRGAAAEALIEAFCKAHEIEEVDQFVAMTLADLSVLHVGAIVGLGVTEGEFYRWEKG